MSNLENKCGDFCYKDEKYHDMPAGMVILISSVLALSLIYSTFRKTIIGAAKSNQRWKVFSNLCQILVRVIWLSSVVNRALRYITSLSSFCFPNIFFFSNQIYIHRNVIFSDEKILENQQPPRKSAKIKFGKSKKSCIVIYISWFIVKFSRRRLICLVRAVYIGSIMTAYSPFYF